MAWRGFEALPPYFGGKRKLCPRIFREIARLRPRETWQSLRLVDPFLGGGSVSLYAKAQGFGVLCGDIAERSFIIGRALIENDSVRLTRDDVLRLFAPVEGRGRLMEETWVPDHLTLPAAQFLDNAFTAAKRLWHSRYLFSSPGYDIAGTVGCLVSRKSISGFANRSFAIAEKTGWSTRRF